MTERIQKKLASMGLGSRREIEAWIVQGLIEVNGQTATLGQSIAAGDVVKLRGQPITLESRGEQFDRVIIYHKPEGEVSSRHDPEGRPTVFDNLPRLREGRWILVGRLDINTTGLMIFTTHGELANRLMHPSHEVEREYACRIHGVVTDEMLARVKQGVLLDDGIAKFENVVEGGGSGANHWYHVLIREGRKREVRRLWESQGVEVSRLTRVRYGNVILPKSLPRGRWMDLSVEDAQGLASLVDLTLNLFEHKGQSQHIRRNRTPTTARKMSTSARGRGSSTAKTGEWMANKHSPGRAKKPTRSR